jgi:lactoylglutathione lyase
MADLGFTGVAHIAIRSRDLEASVKFYSEKLGCAEMFRLHRDNGDLMLVYLRLTDDQYIEVFPEGEGEGAPPPRSVGMNHYCIDVADLDATVAELERRGVVMTRGITLGRDGNRQAWLADPDGVRIELMEMASDSQQAQAIARLRAARR